MWLTHAETLRRILTENVLDTTGTETHIEKKIHIVRQSMFAKFVDVQRRNRALLLRNLPRQAGVHLRSAVADVQVCSEVTFKNITSTNITAVTQLNISIDRSSNCTILRRLP